MEAGRRIRLGNFVVPEWTGNYGDGRLFRNVTIVELEVGETVRVTDYWGSAPIPAPGGTEVASARGRWVLAGVFW